jgi:hypothetical protein
MAHGVNTMEEYCNEPARSLNRWDIQLGKKNVGIMKLLRTARLSADNWEEAAPITVAQRVSAGEKIAWKFLDYGEKGK